MSSEGSTSGENEAAKFVLDEEAKSKLEAETETDGGQETAGDEAPGEIPLPPANLSSLVTAMAGQTVAALGQIPDPISGETILQI